MSPQLRALLVLAAGAVALAVCADFVVKSPKLLAPRDFIEYWSSGRVNLRGGNPYDPEQVLAEQRLAEPERDGALMMWNPPPALALYMPLGALPLRWAALLWCGAQLAAVLVACGLLWRAYATPEFPPAHFAPAVALSFVGAWWVVAYGQNTGLMLLGLAGFLHFTRRGQPVAAGACAALTALKPHLLAVFGVLLVADILARRGRPALAAGVAAVIAALGLALAANPSAVAQFVDAVRNPSPHTVPLSGYSLPTAAYWLRMWLAPEQFWVQFVPCALACAGFLAWRLRAGERWDWSRALPLVVAASVLTTPYGGWIFDLPVLLVPVVWAAAGLAGARRWGLLAAFLAGQAAITAASFAWPGGLHEYWWVAPAALALCLPAVRCKPRL